MPLATRLRELTDRLLRLNPASARPPRMPSGISQFLTRIKSKHDIRTVFDVGANHGRMAYFFAVSFPDATIHAFEPLPGCRIYLERLVAQYPKVTIHAVAIGEKSGQVKMFENAYDQASSLMPMMERHKELWPETTRAKEIEVQVEPLDKLAPGLCVESPAFMKIDTQGYEMSVLKGAVETLRGCVAVMAEVLFEPLYEGQPDFRALLNFMAGQGFHFVEFVDEHRADGKLIYADALFENERFT